VAWHNTYSDRHSSLARRLTVVRRRIGEVLDARDDAPIRILDLCAGDGRDLLPEIAARPHRRVHAVLVELDEKLAQTARAQASALAAVEVRQADAGDIASFADVIPVDLLLLCGIFGNVSTADIRATIGHVSSLLAPGGTVLWTRGWSTGDDLRPSIRRWFREAGLCEIAFDGEPERFGVGVCQLVEGAVTSRPTHGRMFTFVP
jgi:SAM-dependent methyltransferase